MRNEKGQFVKGYPIGYSPMKGKKHTKEWKLKMSERLRGRKLSKEHKINISLTKIGNKNPMFGKTHSQEYKKILSEKRGEKCYFWKGGVTPINKLIRSSAEYKLWREAVFKRDNYTCIWCGIKGGNGKSVILNADHIKPFADYPELRFAIDNGRTLCIDCHKKTDTYAVKNRWNKRHE